MNAKHARKPSPTQVATQFLADYAAEHVSPEQLDAAAAVLDVIAKADLSALTAKMSHDAHGNPRIDTDGRLQAQATWASAEDEQDRARAWSRALNEAAARREQRGDQP